MTSRGKIANGGARGRKKQKFVADRRGRGGSPSSKVNEQKKGNHVVVNSIEEVAEDSWTCELCSTNFANPDAMLLECQRCKNHFCIDCLDKSEEEYEIMANNDDLMWFCPSCRDRVERNIVVDVEIEEKCASFMRKFEDRICMLEKAMKNKCSKTEVKELVQVEISSQPISGKIAHLENDIKSKPSKSEVDEMISLALKSNSSHKSSNIEKSVEMSVSEIRDSSRREKNVIIHGVRESPEDSPDARKEEDSKYVSDLINFVEAERDSFSSVVRLGRKKDDSNKPRPLKVVFKTVDSKKSLMKNLSKLKSTNSSSIFHKISVTHDMTLAEREMNKSKVEEARDRARLDDSGNFTFVVRGPPWDRRVVKLPKIQ